MSLKKLGLDPSKFKHVSSDDKSTTLQHKDGHTLRIAHSVLSPKMQEQLKALSKIAPAAATDDQKQESDDKYGKVTVKDNQPRQNFAKGSGPIQEDPPKDSQEFAAELANPPATRELTGSAIDPDKARQREIYKNLEALDLSGVPGQQKPFNPINAKLALEQQTSEKVKNDQAVEAQKAKIMQENQMRAQFGQPLLALPNTPSGNPIPGSLDANPATDMTPSEREAASAINGKMQGIQDQLIAPASAAPAAAQQPAETNQITGNEDYGSLMKKGANLQIQSANDQAQALGNLGAAKAAVENQNIQDRQKAQAQYQQRFDALETERQAHMQDIRDAHIDPNKYWTGDKNGNGSHSKVASAIGMILAGFNPAGGENAAVNFLKFQMDKNLDAQKENLNSQNNLLRANLAQFGNLKEATMMTQLMQADLVASELNKAADTAASPLAKAAAKAASGQILQQYAPLQQRLAMMQSMNDLGSDPSSTGAAEHMLQYQRMYMPELAKDTEARLIPGIGLAKVPVPQAVRDQLLAQQELEQAVTNLQSFIQSHGGLINRLSPSDRAKAAALVLPVQAKFREGTLGTVYREGEQPLLDKAVKGQPLDLASYFINTEPTKLATMLETNRQQSNITRKQLGLPLIQQQNRQPQSSTGAQEGQTATNKTTGQKIVFKQGQWVPVNGR